MKTEITHKAWPKTPRWFRDVTVTEKIDGTNAAVQIIPLAEVDPDDPSLPMGTHVDIDEGQFLLLAQSRSRLITPSGDNQGFATWAFENADQLTQTLGKGTHFGEWWGRGIQRGYGMDNRMFSLFNTSKWGATLPDYPVDPDTLSLGVVPVLWEGTMADLDLPIILDDLNRWGSIAMPFYEKPEGVIIYHHSANEVFKVLLENDDRAKGAA